MSTTDLPGSSLLAGRYRLVERLGAGGMSVVWRGFDEVLGRQVAVKVLPPSTSTDPGFRRRLRAEAQAAARLTHPNITNVYDYGEATTVDGEPVPYVVMELIDGESLAAVLARARKLSWQHAVRLSAEVAAALAAAHARGIVHRDVTPANVMLTASGAKVVDFGISALIGENDIDPDGSLLGTPAYLAPERLEGGQVSPATDVYAVGLLIYRTLIGQLPWDVGTTTALLRAHQYVEPDPLPSVDGMPPAVAALVGRCLEKRPADRPSSAELAHVLAGIAAGAPVVTRGYQPEWQDSGEDTTILPSAHSFPDVRAAAAVPVPQAPADPVPPRNSAFGELKSEPVRMDVPPPALRPAAGPADPPPIPVPTPAAPTGVTSRGTRRLLVVAGGVALLALATYGMHLTGVPGQEKAASAATQPPVVTPTGQCVVSYAVWSDDGEKFKAEVTLANRAASAVKGWKLWFLLPGDQTLSGNGKVPLVQDDRQVNVASSVTLDAQKAITLPISGRYERNNAAPLAFSLNGETCQTYVSEAPGKPSREVEHLVGGQVRLGAVPSSANPIPGISIAPNGIVKITPTTTAASAGATPGRSSTPPVPGGTGEPGGPGPGTGEESPSDTPTSRTAPPKPGGGEETSSTPTSESPTSSSPPLAEPTRTFASDDCDEEAGECTGAP